MSLFYPIQLVSDYITYNLLWFIKDQHLIQSINFFIYDTIKILILLLFITQVMSFINVIFPVGKIRNFLESKKFYGFEYFLASFFGAITPFCSCSSIPLFIGFLKGGIPLGVTFSFLITSPLVNEVAIAMFIGIFGLKITFIYMFSGIILGVIGGVVLGKMKLEKYVEDFVFNINVNNSEIVEVKKTWKQVWQESSKEGFSITKKVLPYVLLGVGIGALIHGFVPTGFFEKYITKDNIFAVPMAVLIGIPMYANSTSIIPIIQALIVKGVPLGTGLAFMMAVVGLSLPEFLILKKVMKIQLLLIYFGVIGFFMIILGYFFNMFL
ncbi:MAG: permease [Candidatus Gracilibacteria bacterium]|nr:permease [Candidatus Gracilibacteria bacterium]